MDDAKEIIALYPSELSRLWSGVVTLQTQLRGARSSYNEATSDSDSVLYGTDVYNLEQELNSALVNLTACKTQYQDALQLINTDLEITDPSGFPTSFYIGPTGPAGPAGSDAQGATGPTGPGDESWNESDGVAGFLRVTSSLECEDGVITQGSIQSCTADTLSAETVSVSGSLVLPSVAFDGVTCDYLTNSTFVSTAATVQELTVTKVTEPVYRSTTSTDEYDYQNSGSFTVATLEATSLTTDSSLTATALDGPVLTAQQTGVTGVGTLTSLDVSGALSVGSLSVGTNVSISSTGVVSVPTVSVGGSSFSSNTYGGGGALGFSQSWSDKTSSRALDTTYTNNNTRPIQVLVTVYSTSSNTFILYCGDVAISVGYSSATTNYVHLRGVIPVSSTYRVYGTGTISSWTELA
jgi:hypothetical protein